MYTRNSGATENIFYHHWDPDSPLPPSAVTLILMTTTTTTHDNNNNNHNNTMQIKLRILDSDSVALFSACFRIWFPRDRNNRKRCFPKRFRFRHRHHRCHTSFQTTLRFIVRHAENRAHASKDFQSIWCFRGNCIPTYFFIIFFFFAVALISFTCNSPRHGFKIRSFS